MTESYFFISVFAQRNDIFNDVGLIDQSAKLELDEQINILAGTYTL